MLLLEGELGTSKSEVNSLVGVKSVVSRVALGGSDDEVTGLLLMRGVSCVGCCGDELCTIEPVCRFMGL